MAAEAYFLLLLLGLAIMNSNNQKKPATEEAQIEVTEKVSIVEVAEEIEQTTTTLKNNMDLCEEIENAEPSFGKYQLIVDVPDGKYNPNIKYKVSLVSDFDTLEDVPVFTKFYINGRIQLHSKFCREIEEQSGMGIFLPLDENSILNKFYPNTVSEANNEPKTSVEIAWIAPKSGSGCVFISAIPYNNGIWYKDFENLFQFVCENKIHQ